RHVQSLLGMNRPNIFDPTRSRATSSAVMTLAVIIMLLISRQAHGGPVTPSADLPTTAVYQGVISVTNGTFVSGNLLELGANGTDIAGSNELYLRPNRA